MEKIVYTFNFLQNSNFIVYKQQKLNIFNLYPDGKLPAGEW